MTFELWNNPLQRAQFTTLILFSTLDIIVTALRFVATLHGPLGRLGFEDYMAFGACLTCVLSNLASLMAISVLNGRVIEEVVTSDLASYTLTRKWDLVGIYMYIAHTLLVKLSVLGLYWRIFHVRRFNRVAIYVLGFAQSVVDVVCCVMAGFTCQPFARYFDPRVEGECKSDFQIILGGETPNSIIDFAIVGLAMYMIRPLQLRRSDKWKLRVLFGMGGFVVVIGFVKIGITYSTADVFSFSKVAIWQSAQTLLSILCCCLPAFSPLVPRSWSRIRHRMASYISGGRRTVLGTDGSTTVVGSQSASSSGGCGGGWKALDGRQGSVRGLAWAETPPSSSTEGFSLTAVSPQRPAGIVVQREFEAV